jgi:hypothetical protein
VKARGGDRCSSIVATHRVHSIEAAERESRQQTLAEVCLVAELIAKYPSEPHGAHASDRFGAG